ncbi:hypothetical protein NQ015_01755 [Corynebacterium sp. 153RC1]|uniref:hypothetical protein n=1 Tax=unclassified Corynebacterium TaxID=2624378 RepID=UPI00211C23B0|nr:MULTISPECIES: hypothetical protein [unclassified Corynebacterium]MCQ9370654.1 hypothetical protein [Corynebacterium sp. 35RC1]MCQ9352348.1 hypothetical protein [Corynebacterium sp. 209RC1]MCQ9354262.1 hypothetical protein [Corynebacterium sp. 1222RC1]MCQ9356544.1 hypothetical protein [Corynebacterium sp. 122RC1]MCQ9358872.1 hypothetical protein [Corynebacterium sp. 142RC1]
MYDLSHTGWTNRRKEQGRVLVDLHDAKSLTMGTFPRDLLGSEDVTVLGQQWRIDATKQRLTATLPDGSVFTAAAVDKPFGKAHRIDINVGIPVVAINEQRMDWVYATNDAADQKVGQFSGGNNGARNSYTEFEQEVPLSPEQAAFLSLVSRTVMEAKLGGSTLVLTVSLLLLTPIILFMLL